MMDLATLKARNEAVASGRERRLQELVRILEETPRDEVADLLANALFNGFTWDRTPQGGDFWADIWLRLKGVDPENGAEDDPENILEDEPENVPR